MPDYDATLDPEQNLDDAIAHLDEDKLFRQGKILWFNRQTGEFEEVYV